MTKSFQATLRISMQKFQI